MAPAAVASSPLSSYRIVIRRAAMIHILTQLVVVMVASSRAPSNDPMIMVGLANGGNPGESPPATSFDDPAKLASRGFNAV